METLAEHLHLEQKDSIVHLDVVFKGDRWIENNYYEVPANQKWKTVFATIETEGLMRCFDYFDPEDYEIYREDFEDEEEYVEACDEAYAEEQSFMEFTITCKGKTYKIDINGDLIGEEE